MYSISQTPNVINISYHPWKKIHRNFRILQYNFLPFSYAIWSLRSIMFSTLNKTLFLFSEWLYLPKFSFFFFLLNLLHASQHFLLSLYIDIFVINLVGTHECYLLFKISVLPSFIYDNWSGYRILVQQIFSSNFSKNTDDNVISMFCK